MSTAANSGSEPAASAAFSSERQEAELSSSERTEASGGGESASGSERMIPHCPLLAGIYKLKQEQQSLKAERKRVAQALKNQEKKRQRLKAKAKQLTDEDLLQVLNLRAATKAEAAQKELSQPSVPRGTVVRALQEPHLGAENKGDHSV